VGGSAGPPGDVKANAERRMIWFAALPGGLGSSDGAPEPPKSFRMPGRRLPAVGRRVSHANAKARKCLAETLLNRYCAGMRRSTRRVAVSPSHGLDLLKRNSRRLSFRKGQIIFREGESSDALYVIEQGSVEISALIGPRERRVFAIFGPGDYFGEIAVIDSKPRSATATAKGDTVVFCISRDKVWRMFEKSPRLLVTMMHGFSHRLREFDRRYLQELFKQERLALVGRFAQSIVHDFHSPLSNIGFAADLASHGATGKEKTMANVIIRRQVERMTGMIGEVLDFTRSSRSRVALTMTNFDPFIKEMVDELRPECSRKSVSIELKTSPPRIKIPLDRHRLPHVFSNLVRNAIDVLPRGGRIMLSFVLGERDVIIKVEDTGPGISPDISAHLFEPFFTHGKSHGTGLGLSICKRIVEDHKGRISASNRRGGGAVFTFSLPRRAKR
jgi:signal transduction histidine kinase